MLSGPLFAPLPYRNDHPVEVGGDDEPGLAARQCQHRAVLIGQHDRAPASSNRGAGAGRAIDSIDVRWRSDVADGTGEIRRRGAKGKAIAHAADHEWITPAVEHERAGATRAADHNTGLDHIEPD